MANGEALQENEIEATIVVKAAPERSRKYGETVCTAAMFDDGKLIRLYPVPWDVYRNRDLVKWCRIRTKVARSDERAGRPESHKLTSPMVRIDSPLVRGKKGTPWDDRLKLVSLAVTAGGMAELRESQSQTKKSLGVVRVRELIDFRITAPLDDIIDQADYRVSKQKTLTGEPIMEGSRIDQLKHVFRYKWRCYGTCCNDDAEGRGYHDTTCEDWELFESFRGWRKGYEDEKLLWALKNKYFDEIGQTDLHFFMGTPSDPKTQNSWMIIGLFYPHLKKYGPSKETLCRQGLEPAEILKPDSQYDTVEEREGREKNPPAKDKAKNPKLFDY